MLRLVRFGIVCSSVISFALCAIAAFAWSGRELRTSTTLGDLLQIDPPQRSLGDIKAGSVVPVPFALSNRSSRPIRVLGAEVSCMKWGCFSLPGLPVTVPPHSKRELQLMLRAARAGDHEFSTAVNLYLDCPGQPTAAIRMQGRVFEGRGQH